MQARARAVAVGKMQWEIQETSKGGFHFLTTTAALPWPRPPSSLAWIIASPLQHSLCFWPHLLQSSLKTVMPLHILSNSSSLAQRTSWTPHPSARELYPMGSRYLWPPSTWCLLVPPLHEAIFPVGPQAHGTWSCPRELASVCSSPKQPQS